MNTRTIVKVVFFLLTATTLYAAYNLWIEVPTLNLGTLDIEKNMVHVKYEGWDIVFHFWPFAVIVFLVMSLIGLVVGETTEQMITQGDIEAHKQRVSKLDNEIEERVNAEIEPLKKRLEAKERRLKEQADQLQTQELSLSDRSQELAMEIAKIATERANMKYEMDTMQKRMINAIAAAERIKRKADGKKRINIE